MKCCVFKNTPFPSSKKSHFQNEAKCETFVVKMSFICIIIKNHFHINGFALSLALKVRFFGTRKWPIYPFIPPFSSFLPAPRFGTVGFWGQGPGDIKTSQSKGENQQQTQRSCSVTSGGIRTQGLLIGAAPHISFHLRFPIEQKKNFLFYPRFILSFIKPISSFLHMFSLQANKSEFAHVEFFFSPLSGTVRNGTWDESAHQLQL